MSVWRSVILHHHHSAPNLSRLGVFVCGSLRTRGVQAHFACARTWLSGPPKRPVRSSFALCSLVKRRQLLRRTARILLCATRTYACVDFSDSPTDLDGRYIRLARLLQLAFAAVSGDNSMPSTSAMRKSFSTPPGPIRTVVSPMAANMTMQS